MMTGIVNYRESLLVLKNYNPAIKSAYSHIHLSFSKILPEYTLFLFRMIFIDKDQPM